LSTTITFTLTPDEQQRLHKSRTLFASLKRPGFARGVAIFLVVEILLVGGAAFVLNQKLIVGGLMLLGFAGLGPYLWLLGTIDAKAMLRRHLQEHSEATWIIDATGITVRQKLNEITSYWRAVESISRDAGFIVVNVRNGRIFRLPERAADPGPPVAFIDYLERLRSEYNGSTAKSRAGAYSITFPMSPTMFSSMSAFVSGKREGLKAKSRVVPASSGKRKLPEGIIGGIISWTIYEGLVFLQPRLQSPLAWIVPVCFIIAAYIALGFGYFRLRKRSVSQPRQTIPWMTAQGLITVSLLPAGAQVSWDDGSSPLKWDAVAKIDLQDDHLVFHGNDMAYLSIPADAFLSVSDRDAFLNAADQYRRGETPPAANETWPPPALS